LSDASKDIPQKESEPLISKPEPKGEESKPISSNFSSIPPAPTIRD
jgi:hypothetical protein